MCEILSLIALIITAIATAVIAIYTYVSAETSNKIKTLTQEIHEANKISKLSSDKIFWAIAFSNIAIDQAGRKGRLGFLIQLLGWENIKSQLSIDENDLHNAINLNVERVVDDLIRNRKIDAE